MNNMITFKAHYIKPVTIQRKGIDSKYHDCKASLVKLDINSDNDLLALNRLNISWDNCKTILDDITRIYNYLYNKIRPSQSENFFVLTTQKDKFENLDVNAIQGVLQTRINEKKKMLEIEHFQVNPDTNYEACTRKYKGVGFALIEAIKEIFNKNKEIFVSAERYSIPFYEKAGFVKTGIRTNMIFRR